MKNNCRHIINVILPLICISATTLAEIQLEDYETGPFYYSHPASTLTNDIGETNAAWDAGTHAEVEWAIQWSGAASYGATQNLESMDTYQIDIMVQTGQPVEAGSRFYCQLNSAPYVTNAGAWSYWESNFQQTNIPADGQWYRIQFPFSDMDTHSGPVLNDPTNFASIIGVNIGMSGDVTGTNYLFKTAYFDNIIATDTGVTELVISPRPLGTNVLLLEDYTDGGAFTFYKHNTYSPKEGPDGTNNAYDAGKYLKVDWSIQWSGGSSTGVVQNLDEYDTYQLDVKVDGDQPVEDGAMFYAQLASYTPVPYAWAFYERQFPQTAIPADGLWHRVQFPLSSMTASSGGGASNPTDYAQIQGITAGMTGDTTGTNYAFKIAYFDNIAVNNSSITGLVAETIMPVGSVFVVK